MEVTRAIGSPASALPAIVLPHDGGIRERFDALRRHPIAVLRANLEELSFDYPPTVMMWAEAVCFLLCAAATVQRCLTVEVTLPWVALWTAAALWSLLTLPALYLIGREPSPLLLAPTAMIAVAIFLVKPVSADFAPFILVLAVGEFAAIMPKRWSTLYAVVAVAELVAFDLAGHIAWSGSGERLEGLQMYSLGIGLGLMCGMMLQYQRKFLYQERESQQIRTIQAADEERRRIAREVHDVIAHSLSVTLLHLTAARHALQTDRDVDEAVDSLVDAERLGRQAMADIRRTIGLLDRSPVKPAPEPGVGDIAGLVGDFAGAGLDVHATSTGDLDAVTAAVGLALYRIGQESLANVCKHAPTATVTVRLEVDATAARLSIGNTLPAGLPLKRGAGMGLSGMRQRAELLGGQLAAGPYDDGWMVRAEFPLGVPRHCPVVWTGAKSVPREGM
ncbi:histidine kinase [Nocardia sp. NPDC048505]|uniref:sensor histidine kinase n=1 Tax=unclassified Nocardia TaxID=2637762 RepID=UPI0033D74C30